MGAGGGIPEDSRRMLEESVNFFCRHLVGLGVYYQAAGPDGRPVGEKKFTCISCWVLSVRGVWNLVTAGHAIEGLNRAMEGGKAVITECCLGDSFGQGAACLHAIPFTYNPAQT